MVNEAQVSVQDCRSVDESNLEESKSAGSGEQQKRGNIPKETNYGKGNGKISRTLRSQSIRIKTNAPGRSHLLRMDTNFDLDEENSPLRKYMKTKTNNQLEVIEKYLKRDAGTKSMRVPSDFAKFNFELGRMENENLKLSKRNQDSDDDSHVDSGDVELLFPEDQDFANPNDDKKQSHN